MDAERILLPRVAHGHKDAVRWRWTFFETIRLGIKLAIYNFYDANGLESIKNCDRSNARWE